MSMNLIAIKVESKVNFLHAWVGRISYLFDLSICDGDGSAIVILLSWIFLILYELAWLTWPTKLAVVRINLLLACTFCHPIWQLKGVKSTSIISCHPTGEPRHKATNGDKEVRKCQLPCLGCFRVCPT